MRVILLGAPGSGKGTLGERISRATGFPRISTGDLLRKAVRAGTPVGRKAEAVMKAGGLVDDATVTGLVRDRIAAPDCLGGYILDGFPRTVAQAEAVEAIDPARPEVVLDLLVSEDVIVARLDGRRICEACGDVYHIVNKPPKTPSVCDACGGDLVQRPDDAAATVRERLRVYREATAPLQARYRAKGTYRPVDGDGFPEDVYSRAAGVLAGEGCRL
ncbi:MAG TPA: nucleoside monophosphate kinase [Candidatus Aminicenantes bacterium]|nr:nucleoside monophosphate kinase [Acidobacteriota bacterium]HOU48888.1 nucleoside monophosphate kinase [Candidatus Aminicenantes bacterium]HQH45275.1 nucleoside monophosphate kinase [Candidatus Aminicenantes bacterium]HQJ43224.1 nucleoside monophosphate kinase [Candidatus Aminicenantes bacterium]